MVLSHMTQLCEGFQNSKNISLRGSYHGNQNFKIAAGSFVIVISKKYGVKDNLKRDLKYLKTIKYDSNVIFL